MDRLLSEVSIKQLRLLPENEDNTYSEMMIAVAKSQLAKDDTWWIEQMESKFFPAIRCRLFPDNCDSCSVIDRCIALDWQQFKTTLEVK